MLLQKERVDALRQLQEALEQVGEGTRGGMGTQDNASSVPWSCVNAGPPWEGAAAGAHHSWSQPATEKLLLCSVLGLGLAQGGGAALGSTSAQMCCSPEVTQMFHPAHQRGCAGTVGSAGCIGQQAPQLGWQGQGQCLSWGCLMGQRWCPPGCPHARPARAKPALLIPRLYKRLQVFPTNSDLAARPTANSFYTRG